MVIIASPECLTIRNLLRDHQIAWIAVTDLGDPPRYGTWRKPGMHVVLVSGDVVSATLLAKGPLSDLFFGDFTAKAVEQFRQYRAQAG
ncbi:MAG: hypothetical protein WAN48_08135 [Actinomycetes bacterium]